MALEFKTTLLIKDPIYGYVELTELEERIIQTPIFQRLRFITQNGLAFYTYPSIRGSRFEHSMGACHLAGRVMTSIFEHSDDQVLKRFLQQFCKAMSALHDRPTFEEFQRLFALDESKFPTLRLEHLTGLLHFAIQLVRLLALLHDIGHLPFSHLGEEAAEEYAKEILGTEDYEEYQKLNAASDVKLHEFLGYKLIAGDFGGLSKAFVSPVDQIHLSTLKNLYRSKLEGTEDNRGAFSKLYELVAADIDVDRGDYLRRDGYGSGVGFGSYDIDRLIESITLDEVRREGDRTDFLIAPSDASISAVETFLVERYKLYKWLYYHHSIRYFNYCLTKSLKYVIGLRDVLPRLKDKFKIEYFGYKRYIFDDGFIANEIWLWDVFYLTYIDLKQSKEPSPEVKQALVYLDVIKWRRKLGFTIWKTHPEYLDFNRRLKAIICKEQESDSLGPQHCKMGDVDLTETPERLFFNLVLHHIRKDTHLKQEFLKKFYSDGIPIPYGDIKSSCPGLAVKDEERVGTVFLVLNEFVPFAKSSISTSDQVVSQVEFLLRKKRGSKKVIRLTEVSRLAASLYDAWQSDIQSFLYFIVSSTEFETLVEESRRQLLAGIALERFCEAVATWLIKEKRLVSIGA